MYIKVEYLNPVGNMRDHDVEVQTISLKSGVTIYLKKEDQNLRLGFFLGYFLRGEKPLGWRTNFQTRIIL